jgi:amino acid adenylation domain-containing protein
MSSVMSAGYELSPQQKLFFARARERLTAGIAVLIEGRISPGKIRDVVQTLIARHEILRTTFQRRTGMKFPFQVVNEKGRLVWEEINLSAISTDEQQSRVSALLRDSAWVSIEKGPVVRGQLMKTGSNRHVLALAFSALCVDDASLNQLLKEFTSVYAGKELVNEALQYADYSEWQSEVLGSNDQQAAEFWARSEFESLPALSVPFERNGPSGEAVWDSVGIPLNLAVEAEASEFLFAAWQAFLGRISGRQEFVSGFLSDGRNHEEFSTGMGLFVRPLPIKANLEGNSSFGEHLREAQASVAAALDLQDHFSAERIAGHVPAGFSFYELPQKATAGDVAISELARIMPSAAFRLQLRCVGNSAVLQAALDYDPNCFHTETIVQLAERFAVFAKAAQAEPTAPISALPIMTPEERRQILVEFNRTAAEYPAEYPQDKCVHELFEAQAAQYPGRPALRFGERELTYAELNREANRIAHVLRSHGVGPNVPVALCLERSAEMITALLGILKAGGCYVPLVPDNPKPRLAHQLAETAAPVILTEEKHLANLPEFRGKIICLDRDRSSLAGAPDSNPDVKVSSQDLVYVIYTSGSTGTPKGVAVRHFNLVNYSHFISHRLKLNEHREGLNFATVSTISADLGNTCIFPSLISGGCLHVIGFETAMSPTLLGDYVTAHPVDVLKITPSHFSSLLNAENGDALLPRKYLILGGEATRWDLVKRIQRATKCALLNHYGPTEATVGCCTFSADSDVRAWEPATLPIGKPIANDEIYIVDSLMQPTPIGVAGELCIGGTGLAQGYLNQPQQTAARFVDNPFSSDPDARIYRTGDLARFLPDGNIEFLGRIDAQVKIRGFRVEPAEIESVLRTHPSVDQAAIVSYESDPGEKKLAAYVVSRSQIRTEDLRAFLGQELPEYMVPSAFVLVNSLPLTSNGKLDLRALPKPEQQAPVCESVAPRNAEEEKLAMIWREVLKRDAVGVNDNFFELGGHSLLATQIISRIRSTFRVQMPLHSFLQSPTIASLAKQIGNCPAIESEEEEMARLLRELEGISDEEAERLLSTELQKNTDRAGR